MIKKYLTLIFLLSTFFNLFAQHTLCNGNRYKNIDFTSIQSAIGIQYGQNITMNNITKNLLMDIYQPEADTTSKRPLMIYIHGGGFIGGNRQEGLGYSANMALRGFVAATIDYRLIDISLTLADSTTLATALIHAISDAKAAVRFFVQDAATNNIYKVDTNFIFISGASAGGITASHLAYLNSTDSIPAYFSRILSNNGGFKGNSSINTMHTTPIKGVVNYSGALWRKEWISVGEAAIFSAHDNFDTIVPCNYNLSKAFYPTYTFPVYLEGSCAMHDEADTKGIYNEIYIKSGNGHVSYSQSLPLIDSVLSITSKFLYNVICQNSLSIKSLDNSMAAFQFYPNPASTVLNIEILMDVENAEIKIYNRYGQIVKRKSIIDNRELSIETTDLINGLYFIVLQNKEKQINKKLIINH